MEIERTACIIKPDVEGRYDQNSILEEIKLHFKNMPNFNMEIRGKIIFKTEQVELFYAEHSQKPFFKDILNYMTKGPSVLFVLSGQNIISEYRELIGFTNPKNAAPGTLRYKYGKSLDENSFHGSDSKESAQRELLLFDIFFINSSHKK